MGGMDYSKLGADEQKSEAPDLSAKGGAVRSKSANDVRDQRGTEVRSRVEKNPGTPSSEEPPRRVTTLFTESNLVEDMCAVGDPIIIEWKGMRYPTRMRGAKSETILTNITGKKARKEILAGTSFLITDIPKEFAAAGFEMDAPMTVRFLFDGSVYAFKTALMQVHSHPPILLLQYPDQEQRYNMRSKERLPVVAPAQISPSSDAVEKRGVILNISQNGALAGLQSVDGINVGNKLNLTFRLPNGEEVSGIVAVVKSIDKEDDKYLLGTNFIDPFSVIGEFCRNIYRLTEGIRVSTAATKLGVGKEAAIEISRKKGKVMVRGWKAGENGYLLTDKPQGEMPPLTPGQEAVIREENKGVVYCTAVKYSDFLKKANLLHFTFNMDLIEHPLRAGERINCLIPIEVNFANNRLDLPLTGAIINLGRGGLRIIPPSSLYAELGDILSTNFYLCGTGFVNGLKMKLMRATPRGNRFEYATQYVDVDSEQGRLLDSYFAFCREWNAVEHH